MLLVGWVYRRACFITNTSRYLSDLVIYGPFELVIPVTCPDDVSVTYPVILPRVKSTTKQKLMATFYCDEAIDGDVNYVHKHLLG